MVVTSTTNHYSFDFGDGGVLQYGGASKGGRGIGLVADYIPAADSAVYTLTSTAGDELGVARGASGTDNLVITSNNSWRY